MGQDGLWGDNINMKQEQMLRDIRKQTEKAQSVDISREFEIVKLMKNKWRGRVIFEIIEKSPRTFGELKKEVPGISSTVLTTVLKSLMDRGIVIRTQIDEAPIHVEYTLTEKGEAMIPLFYEMLMWEAAYYPESFR